MRLIVQQTACPANLIKLRLNAYSYHGCYIIPDRSFSAVVAVHRAGVSLHMAGRNRRRDFGMDQRFCLADTDAHSPAVLDLATDFTLLAITYIYRGRDRMGVHIKHRYIMPGNHHHLRCAQ